MVMDIASDPITATDPPSLAKPPLILREDYTPFPWLVPHVALFFDLGIEKTVVRSQLSVERNPTAEASSEIRLDGDEITPLGVRVDGEDWSDWRMEDDDLIIALPREAHQIAIET